MEASALPAPSGLSRTRLAIGAPLLRLRSDEQLVALFRGGNNEAFRVIHDRYRQRLFAYARQMLAGSRQDAEDALQDVFVRAYSGLRANDRQLALRAWLYRVAHNRCIDELRRPAPPAPEMMELVRPPLIDPIEEAEQRESLRRLIADLQGLPEQQRSALLMRELGGMSYVELAAALGVSVPAIKSLLVRARVGLAQAVEAREAPCVEIREEMIVAHDRGVRASGMARRHLRDCPGCREFRGQLRGTSKQFAALLPALGPASVLAKLLGFSGGAGGGAAASGSATAGTGALAAGGILGTGTVASVGVLATGAGHVATLLAAAVVTAGGAVEIQHTIAPAHHSHHRAVVVAAKHSPPASPAPVVQSVPAAVVVQAPPAPVAAPAAPPVSAPTPPVGHNRASRDQPWLPPKPVPNLTMPYGSSPDSGTGAGSTAPGTTGTGTTGTGSPGAGTGTATGTGTVTGTGTGSGAPGSTTATGSSGGSSTPTSGGAAGSGSGATTGTGTGGTAGSGTGTSSSKSGSGGSPTGSSAGSTGSSGTTTTG